MSALPSLRNVDRPSPGTKRVIWVESPGIGAGWPLPVLAVGGRLSGPVCICTGGVHGDEFEGPLAIQRTYAELDPEDMAGVFLGLPICNPAAFEHQSRESPPSVDGLNLARVFPGNAGGRPTERLAADLFEFIVRMTVGGGFVVDLHSGGTRYAYLPMVGFRDVAGPVRLRSEALARHFGIPRVWIIPDQPGPLNAATSRYGIPTVGTEATGRGGAIPADVDAFASGLRRLLVMQGMVAGPRPEPISGPAWRTTQVLAPADGLWIAACALGEAVAEGQGLGRVVGPLGDVRGEVTSPQSGEVWALRSFASIRAGDIACLVGRPDA